jgi:hypothetical protein
VSDLARSECGSVPEGEASERPASGDGALVHRSFGSRWWPSISRPAIAGLLAGVLTISIGVSTAGATTSDQAAPSVSSSTQKDAPEVPPVGGAVPGNGAFNALTCPKTGTCVAVGADAQGQAAVSTSEGDGSWTKRTLPSNAGPLQAVSCSSTTHCVAVGRGAILSSHTGGGQWQLHRPPANTTLLGDTCASASNCLAVGIEPDLSGAYAGVILRSTDGGNSWKWANLPPNAPEVGAVACPTTTRCIAVGATVLTSDDGGATWQQRGVTGGVVELQSIACSSATHCVAVGQNPLGLSHKAAPALAIETNDAGNTWQPETFPAGTATADQVTCPSATECFVSGPAISASVGPTFEASADGGHSWTKAQSPHGLSEITDISCPASDKCALVGRSGKQAATAASTDAGAGTPADATSSKAAWSTTTVSAT